MEEPQYCDDEEIPKNIQGLSKEKAKAGGLGYIF